LEGFKLCLFPAIENVKIRKLSTTIRLQRILFINIIKNNPKLNSQKNRIRITRFFEEIHQHIFL
jgi:hypothetical protein